MWRGRSTSATKSPTTLDSNGITISGDGSGIAKWLAEVDGGSVGLPDVVGGAKATGEVVIE